MERKAPPIPRRWTDTLPEDVYARLCNCSSLKSDILPLARARWNYIKGRKGWDKEDALVSTIELLDENGIDFGLTCEEYDDILACIR